MTHASSSGPSCSTTSAAGRRTSAARCRRARWRPRRGRRASHDAPGQVPGVPAADVPFHHGTRALDLRGVRVHGPTHGRGRMRWVGALQAARRPNVSLALGGALVYGFVTTLVNAEAFLSVVGMVVTFWFSQRQMGRAEGTLPPTVAPRQEKP